MNMVSNAMWLTSTLLASTSGCCGVGKFGNGLETDQNDTFLGMKPTILRLVVHVRIQVLLGIH